MNKKKVTGIIAVAAIVVIILIAAGSKKQSPAPEELTGEDRNEEAANSGNGVSIPVFDPKPTPRQN